MFYAMFGRYLPLGMIVWSVAMIAVAALTGFQHDYRAYLRQWALVLSGVDPWSGDNAYGPLHNVFALPFLLSRMAPKLITVTALVAVTSQLAIDAYRQRGGLSLALFAICLPANVVFIGIGVIYGLNDGIVAALVGAALLCRFRARLILAGVLLGLAALEKYYPVLLVVPFALEDRRLRLPLVASAAATFGAGMVVALLVWGPSTLDPIFFGMNRGAMQLTILAAAQSAFGSDQLLHFLGVHNASIVLLATALSWVAAWYWRWHWLETAVVSLLVALTAYKLGNVQFYLPLLVMVAALPLVGTRRADHLAAWCIPLVLFLSLYQWGYEFGSDRYHQILPAARSHGGFVAFALQLTVLLGFAAEQIAVRRRTAAA